MQAFLKHNKQQQAIIASSCCSQRCFSFNAKSACGCNQHFATENLWSLKICSILHHSIVAFLNAELSKVGSFHLQLLHEQVRCNIISDRCSPVLGCSGSDRETSLFSRSGLVFKTSAVSLVVAC